MKHLSVLRDRSCNVFGFFQKAILEGGDMDIELTAPHIDLTDDQKSYLEKRLNKVDCLIQRPIYCRVTLDNEKMILLPKSTFLFRGAPSS